MSTDLDALQTTLGAEHAAVHLYGVLAARTSQSAQPALFALVRDGYVAHRDRRDELIGRVASAGAQPVGAEVAYVVPAGDLSTPAGVSAVAAEVETACTTTYAAQVGVATGETRRLGIGWLSESAVRALAFRGTPEMFPGAGEHAGR